MRGRESSTKALFLKPRSVARGLYFGEKSVARKLCTSATHWFSRGYGPLASLRGKEKGTSLQFVFIRVLSRPINLRSSAQSAAISSAFHWDTTESYSTRRSSAGPCLC